MKDIIALQYAFYRGLRSCSLFADFNIVLGREFLVAEEAKMAAIWQTPGPTGKSGLGMIIFVPDLLFPQPNGLQRQREFSIGIFEDRNVNYLPATVVKAGGQDLTVQGTGIPADDVGDLVIDFLWNWRLWRTSGLTFPDRALVQDRRFDGIYGVRAISILRQERGVANRPSEVTITDVGGRNITLTNTDGSDIWFTTDGFSYPGPDNNGSLAGETAATKYVGVFNVAANTTVFAASFANGKNPGQTAVKLIA